MRIIAFVCLQVECLSHWPFPFVFFLYPALWGKAFKPCVWVQLCSVQAVSSTDSSLFWKTLHGHFFLLSNGSSFMFVIFCPRTTSSLISVIQPRFHWDFPWIFSYENRRADASVLTSVFSVLNLLECASGSRAHGNSSENFFQWLLSVTAEQGTHVKRTAQLEGYK